MKFLSSQFAYLFSDREARGNLTALVRYLAFLTALIAVYTVLFHVIMTNVEGHEHSWITGLYWTLVVMSTLGFGDITFTSDTGRLFSVVVLVSGVVFLLVLLPFLFIRLFYAPWLEARMRLRAPRAVGATMTGHVVITEYDSVAAGLVDRLTAAGIPYVLLEPDPAVASQRVSDGVSVVAGEVDAASTYRAIGLERARLLVANGADTSNTNITLTVREVSPDVPIVAIVEEHDAIDILQLSGATHVLPLKQQLGEYLANRADTGRLEAHVIGRYRSLHVAEFPVRHTRFAGVTVRDTRLRETLGMNVVGIWQRGRLQPANPNVVIAPESVVVVAGTAPQIARLNEEFPQVDDRPRPVLVVGAGSVGVAAVTHLKSKGVPTHVVDRDARALKAMDGLADLAVEGDAADRKVLHAAGLQDAPTVLLTTNADAMNIYLAVYCRRLQADIRIVSRVTHDRNVEAIHRAGADFVLSYASLGAEAVYSLLTGHELVILGEGVDLFTRPVPRALEGRTLQEGRIGTLTGVCVLGIQSADAFTTEMHANTRLPAGGELVMMGSLGQRRAFGEIFEAGRPLPERLLRTN